MAHVYVDYHPPKDLMASINALRTPRPFYSFALILFDHLLIWMPGMTAVTYLPEAWLIVCAPFIWLVATRSMRGLECIVHEGSHYNLFGRRPTLVKKLSDLACNLLAAVPLFSTVQRYRASHTLHHTDLGFGRDPDKIRHEELQLSMLDRQHFSGFVRGVSTRLIQYIPGWWHAIGTTQFVALLGALWHTTAIAVIYYFDTDLVHALSVWLFVFGIPFFFFLPVIRFIGEAAKHDYQCNKGLALETFSNTGLIHTLLVHPHCDGFHTLHHLFPHVPHSRLPQIDRLLKTYDNRDWLAHLRERKHILQDA
jgi:fatty acid desaturase